MSNDITEVSHDIVEIDTSKEKYEAIESDLEEVKMNLLSTSEKLNTEIPTLIELAASSQHPGVYEALAKIVNSFAKVNAEAAKVIKQRQELYDSFRKAGGTNTLSTYNDNRSVVFHGTTTDLLDEILEDKDD